MSDKPELINVMQESMWGPFSDIVSLDATRPTSLEDRITRLEDEQAVRDLHSKYTYFYDEGSVDGVMQVFDKDCLVVNPRGTYVGHSAIRENYEYLISTRRYSFHTTSNVVVRISAKGDDAVMTSFLIGTNLHRPASAGAMLGTYVDRIRKTEGRWVFVERRITSNFRYWLSSYPTLDLPAPAPKPTREENTRGWLGSQWLL